MAEFIDGKQVAKKVIAECAESIKSLKLSGLTPGLAVVLIGEDPASQVYVSSKVKKCKELGIHSEKIVLAKDSTQEEVLAVVERLNNDDKIHGILVQSPPPKHINEEEIVLAIAPEKDVDGFHPVNVAKLVLEDNSGFVPCTPAGCMRLLKEYNIETAGAEVVVIGRSMIVGKPMALLLMGRNGNATVTVAHSRTKDITETCKTADIVIAALGKPNFVTADMVKEGAVVIDVGINRVEDKSTQKGYKIVGDVDFQQVESKCKAITPVPGGVGPMTIAMLISNTIKAAAATI